MKNCQISKPGPELDFKTSLHPHPTMGAYSSFYWREGGIGKIRIFGPFSGKIRISRGKIWVSGKKLLEIKGFGGKIVAKLGEMSNIYTKPRRMVLFPRKYMPCALMLEKGISGKISIFWKNMHP